MYTSKKVQNLTKMMRTICWHCHAYGYMFNEWKFQTQCNRLYEIRDKVVLYFRRLHTIWIDLNTTDFPPYLRLTVATATPTKKTKWNTTNANLLLLFFPSSHFQFIFCSSGRFYHDRECPVWFMMTANSIQRRNVAKRSHSPSVVHWIPFIHVEKIGFYLSVDHVSGRFKSSAFDVCVCVCVWARIGCMSTPLLGFDFFLFKCVYAIQTCIAVYSFFLSFNRWCRHSIPSRSADEHRRHCFVIVLTTKINDEWMACVRFMDWCATAIFSLSASRSLSRDKPFSLVVFSDVCTICKYIHGQYISSTLIHISNCIFHWFNGISMCALVNNQLRCERGRACLLSLFSTQPQFVIRVFTIDFPSMWIYKREIYHHPQHYYVSMNHDICSKHFSHIYFSFCACFHY